MLVGSTTSISHRNNFDLIRLLAACQVLVIHVTGYMRLPLWKLATFFPGVPVFFMISGFLVTASLDRSPDLAKYAIARALRIYPALWCMTLVTIVLLAALGHLNANTDLPRFAMYILGQSSVFQIVDGGLGLFKDFGTGGVNGVLWTLATELQFYAILPILFLLAGTAPRRRWLYLGAAFLTSVFLYEWIVPAWISPALSTASAGRRTAIVVIYTSAFPHLFGFLIGVFFYLGFGQLRRVLEGRVIPWAVVYAIFVYVVGVRAATGGWALEQHPTLMLTERVLLAFLVFSFAFTFRGLSYTLLRGHDVSYGVYIYQMLVINTLVEFRLSGTWYYAMTAYAATFALSLASWTLIERPALRLKSKFSAPKIAQVQV